MKRLIFRAAATADLRAIARSTRADWGDEQAATYVAALRLSIKSLLQFGQRFPQHEETHRGLRKMRSGHHLVFYLVADDVVEIVRILHERMDTGARLGE
ncbi:MAG: type II toxin-antitoxin system RelE/ParE family toxin [Alphaproteobacteria bacterium]|nr:type II toxin-antitoxin system RelE/ParE family toxin [Alphaproteobacteria bacterium]